ncbi:MAG TPA: hypothetical protein VEO74_08610 [Thermoanaerobaculia bacterium]|nr:hypothetical protein [Thermoanaerobaculia bacterium]
MKMILCALAIALPLAAQQYDVERPIAVRRSGIASAVQTNPAIASDGENFFVVWSDGRALALPNHSNLVAMGARIDGDGNVLDVPNVGIPSFLGAWMLWTGTNYLRYDNSQYVRLTRDGALLDPKPLVLPGPPPRAFNGSRFLALSQGNDQLNVILLDETLKPIKTTSIAGKADGYAYDIPADAASNGDTFVVAYTQRAASVTSLWYAVIDRSGNLVSHAKVFEAARRALSFRVASDGRGYLILLQMDGTALNTAMFVGAILDGGGALQTVIPQFGQLAWNDKENARLAWTGSSYSLVMVNGYLSTTGQTTITPISSTGTVGAPIAIGVAGRVLGLAFSGRRAVLLRSIPYTDEFHGSHEGPILGDAFTAAADFSDGRTAPFRVGQGAFAQQLPAAATAASGLALVAWQENVEGGKSLALYATRVDATGAVVDAQSIHIDDEPCSTTPPSVATDGRDFLVAWATRNGIYTRGIGADGRLTPFPVYVYSSPAYEGKKYCFTNHVALAWNGSEYLLGWIGSSDLHSGAVVRTTRLTARGEVIDGQLPEIPAIVQFYDSGPLIASDGRDFLVELYPNVAVRVYANGTIGPLSTAQPVRANTLFFDGNDYVVVGSIPANPNFYAVPLSADGLPLEGAGANTWTPLRFSNDVSVACDAGGCTAAEVMLSSIVVWPLRDRSKTPQIVAAVDATSFPANVILLPGALPRLIYTRVAPEYTYVNRVFIRTPQVRRRAAGH